MKQKKIKTLLASLRSRLLKLTLIFLLIAVLAVVALLTVILHTSTRHMMNENILEAEKQIEYSLREMLTVCTGYAADDYLSEIFGNSVDDVKDIMNLEEVSIFNSEGIITESTNAGHIGVDLKANEKTQSVTRLLSGEEFYVVRGSARDGEFGEWDEYGMCRLDADSYIYISLNREQHYIRLTNTLTEIAKFTLIGEKGFELIASIDGEIISAPPDYSYESLSDIGLDKLTKTAEPGRTQSVDILGGRYYAMYSDYAGYRIIVTIPESEILSSWYMVMFVVTALVIIFLVILFIRISFLTKNMFVKNVDKINSGLEQISKGKLDTVIDVREHKEFSELSDGINSTVAVLKDYIAKESERIEEELELARSIQISALPGIFPPYPDRREFDIFASMDAAREVGGDFYDFFFVDDTHLVFLVADVSDKGIPAALFMMKAKTVLKSLMQSNKRVDEVLKIANNTLCENNGNDMFVTVWIGILNTLSGMLSFSNAGHCKPVLKTNGGDYEFLNFRANHILGGIEGAEYKKHEIQLHRGDAVFIYTDGVTESVNTENELFGEQRLLKLLNSRSRKYAREVCADVKSGVREFSGGAPQSDDITMLSIIYNGTENMNEITVSAKQEKMAEVMEFLESKLSAVGAEDKASAQLGIVVDEICCNIINYAYPDSQGDLTVSFSFDEHTRTVTMTFTDRGIHFNPLNAEPPNLELNPDERDEGGLGIFLIKRYTDDMRYEYKHRKNILTIKKKI